MLKILRRIIEKVQAARDPEHALQDMVTGMRNAMQVDAVSIFLLDYRYYEYLLMATDGLNQTMVGMTRIALDEGPIGVVGKHEEPLNVADVTQEDCYLYMPELGDEEMYAFLGVPVIYRRRVLGVIVAQRKIKQLFDEEEEAFLVTIAAQLSPYLAKADISEALAKQVQTTLRQETGLTGISAAPGIGLGQAIVMYPLTDMSTIPDKSIDDISAELERFEHALNAVRHDVQAMRERIGPSLPPAEQILFDAYLGMLDGHSLGGEIADWIKQGNWAEGAVRQVVQRRVQQFEDMEDEYLRERSSDIQDLGRRIFACLQTEQRKDLIYPEKTILVAEEIGAADIAEVPPGNLVGIVTIKGSSNSHAAILAKALNVPTVMGVSELPLTSVDGKLLIVDGYYGRVYIDPSESLRAEYQRFMQQELELDEALKSLRTLKAETIDGHRIKLCVNVGLEAKVQESQDAGAEGVGLYRTELPFMVRESFPSEQEQYTIYRQILTSFAPQIVTMRTLDIGGDKALSYFPIEEDNPFLGWRGVRISLDQPELYLTQVRAMLRANLGLGNLQIMIPMVSGLPEFDEASNLIRQAHRELRNEYPAIILPPIGTMIEVPSAVYHAASLAQRADFLSIGSNDLTQYLLAVDRNNARVSNLYDSLHPAVIMALKHIAKAGQMAGTPVTICGEMAGDPLAVILLIAMGFDGLSMTANSIARIKWIIRRFTVTHAKSILKDVTAMESATEIRAHLRLVLQRAGLGALIRNGN